MSSDGRSLRLRRDAIGHAPLFWGRAADGAVHAATHLGPLLGPLGRPPLDPLGVAAFLSCAYVPAPWSLIQGISAVEPGTEVVVTATGAHRAVWAELPAAPRAAPDEVLRARLRSALSAAVDRALPTHGGVGAFLSGGIDSSLVVALARRHVDVTALSLHFGAPHRDELPFSRAVARHCGAAHVEVLVLPGDVERRFDATVAACPSPNGDPLTVPNDRLFSEARSRGLSVVLNGEGGDPCFGGPKNAPMMLSALYGERPDLGRAYLSAHQRCFDDLPAAMDDGATLQAELAAGPRAALEADDRAFLDRLMWLNVRWKGAGHILPKVFGIGRAHGVQARSPLFDAEIVAHAFELPPDAKRRGAVEKYLLKEAVRDLLPAEVVDRPKSGMMVPVESWFEGPLRGFAEERLLDGLAPRGLVRRDWLERLARRQVHGLRPRRGVKLWLLLTLEAFLRVVYDPSGRTG